MSSVQPGGERRVLVRCQHAMVMMQVIKVSPSARDTPQLLHCQDLSLPKLFACRETVFDALPLFGQLFPQLTASGPFLLLRPDRPDFRPHGVYDQAVCPLRPGAG